MNKIIITACLLAFLVTFCFGLSMIYSSIFTIHAKPGNGNGYIEFCFGIVLLLGSFTFLRKENDTKWIFQK